METEPKLIDTYVRTGKARLVYRHLLQLGAGSLFLSEVSECAGAQGKFWEARQLLYSRQDETRGASDVAAILPVLEDLALDEAAFRQCVEQHQFREQVEKDYAAAQREGVTSRPVVEIGRQRLIGAQGYEQYAALLDATPGSE